MTDLLERPDPPRSSSVGSGPAAPPVPEPVGAWGRFSQGTIAGRSAVLLGGIGLGLVGMHALGLPTPPCPLRSATNFPCPFCGLTHLARDLLTGHLGLVASRDPAGFVLAVALVVAVVAQLFAVVRKTDGPKFMTSRVLGSLVLVALAVHWGTTIVTGGLLVV